MISEQDWQNFFDVLDKIVSGDLPWKDKRDLVLKKAREYGSNSETNLEEIGGWFEGE